MISGKSGTVRILYACHSICLATLVAVADDAPRFIPATTENTSLEGGIALEMMTADPEHPHQITRGPHPPTANHRWHWWETKGIACFATSGEAGHDAPVLRTLVSGLRPNADYQVDGFFRAVIDDGTEAAPRGDIRMGFTIARTEAFGPRSRQGLSCIIGVDHSSKRVARWQPQIVDSQPADHPDFPLFRVSLGVARSDAQGTLVVFIDDQPNDTLAAATFYEGVTVSPAPNGSEPAAGAGSPQVLVEAVRVGDRETMNRELAAGADLNQPDREGLTALYYACLAGDHDLVTRFLKAGAKPDAANQRLPPLWAAARNGETELAGALLDAGAEVTTACLADRQLGDFMQRDGPVQINPVSAAVLSGSVETLEALLKKHPGIDLGKAVFGPGYEFKEPADSRSHPPGDDLIRLSMGYENFNMVRWLIDRGHSLKLKESLILPAPPDYPGHQQAQSGARSQMIRAIVRQSPRMDIVDALAARGVPIVMPADLRSNNRIIPWDGLSAAVFEGNADLVRRWLPLARDAREEDRINLITLADASGCGETAALMRDAFPGTRIPTFKDADHRSNPDIVADTSGFIPRVVPPDTGPVVQHRFRMAVIGAGRAAGPADALAVHASHHDGLEVVDREELSARLAERAIAVAEPLSGKQLHEVGSLLGADMIVTVSSFGSNADMVLRFEGHDVRTGITLHRVFQLARQFEPEVFSRDFLPDLLRKLGNSRAGETVSAITILGIVADPGYSHGVSLAPTVVAGLLQEIDASPGLVALSRQQLAPLVEEQALGHAGGLWGAAWTLEGGLRKAQEPERVILALRIRGVANEKVAHDVTVEGTAASPQDLVARAWATLRQKINLAAPVSNDDPARAKLEAKRLAREAEWLLMTPLAPQAAELADAALYLGGNQLVTLTLRRKCYWVRCHLRHPRVEWTSWNQYLGGFPEKPRSNALHLKALDDYLEMLRITTSTVTSTIELMRGKSKSAIVPLPYDLLLDVERLTEFRGRLKPESMPDTHKSSLRDFDEELRALWEAVLAHHPDHAGRRLQRMQVMTCDFRQLPWLGDMLAASLLHAANRLNLSSKNLFMEGVDNQIDETTGLIDPRTDSLATLIEKNLTAQDPHATLRRAEIEWLRTHGPGRIAAAKHLCGEWVDTLRTCLSIPDRIIAHRRMSQSYASQDSNAGVADGSPFGMPLSSLVAAPRRCVDMEFRHFIYHRARRNFAIASTAPQLWLQGQKNLTRGFRDDISKLVERSSPPEDYELLMVAAREADDLFGTGIVPAIERAVHSARPKHSSAGTFGASGGFRVATRNGALTGSILTDVRSGLTDEPAHIVHHAVDPKDRNLLWLVVVPQPEKELIIHEFPRRKMSDMDRYVCSQPWLLGIDCRDGSVVRRINLIRAAFGDHAPAQSAFGSVGAFMGTKCAFNDDGVLLLVSWRLARGMPVWKALAINRNDGSVIHSVPVSEVLDEDLHKSNNSNIVGLGNDFYILNIEKGRHLVTKISPGHEPLALNSPGRRPEETPFDAPDKRPKLLRVDNGRVLVASSWDHAAHYDPATDRWTRMEMARNSFQRHVGKLEPLASQPSRHPELLLQLESGSAGHFALAQKSEAGVLVYYKHARQPLRLPVNLPVDSPYPGTFRISPGSVGSGVGDRADAALRTHPPESVSIHDLARSDMVRPAILNQTDEHLIVGLYLEIEGASGIRFRTYQHLPYLWKIPKTIVRERLQRELDGK